MRIPKLTNLFGKKPDMNEQAKTLLVSAMGLRQPAVNDDLVNLKGAGCYSQMRHDPDVKTGLTIKTEGLFTKGWELHPGEEKNAAADEQAEFVENCLNEMQGSLDDVLVEILRDALIYGTSITERVWMYDEASGKIAYKAIKPKDPATFTFDTDEFSNVTALRQNNSVGNNTLDITKFAIFRYQSEHGNPWGTSDLRGAYRFWWAKQKLMDWWLVFLEKYGTPTVKGTYPKGTAKQVQDKLMQVLSSIKQETAIVIPDDIVVDLLAPQYGGAQSGYEAALDYCGQQIIKNILGQTLTTGEGKRVGSMALGQVHEDVQDIYISKLRRKLEEFVDEEIIRPLVDYNFAEPIYPNFSLTLEEKDTTALADMLWRLIQAEVVDGREPWIREYLGLPEDERDKLPELPEPEPPSPDEQNQEQTPPEPEQ